MTAPFHNTDHSSLISNIQECSGEQSSEFSPAPQCAMHQKVYSQYLSDRIYLFSRELIPQLFQTVLPCWEGRALVEFVVKLKVRIYQFLDGSKGIWCDTLQNASVWEAGQRNGKAFHFTIFLVTQPDMLYAIGTFVKEGCKEFGAGLLKAGHLNLWVLDAIEVGPPIGKEKDLLV